MKDYFIIAPMIALALFPPAFLRVPMVESALWVWLVLIFGFLGLWSFTMRLNIFIKLFLVYAFISCFFSSGLYLSFTRYIPLVLCIYYYILCQKIENWRIVYKALAVVMAVHILLFIMQLTGNDTLCNFALEKVTCSGAVGNWMQMKTLMILILAFFISAITSKNRKVLYCLIALILIGMVVYALSGKNIYRFPHRRLMSWKDTLRVASLRPVFGWGLGSFGPVFNALADDVFKKQGYWHSPHNTYLHVLFEFGNLGLWIFSGYLTSLGLRLLRHRLFYPLIGFILLLLVMSFHFPLHQTTTVLLVMCFLAYLEARTRSHYGIANRNS
jgi:hypothetical protein